MIEPDSRIRNREATDRTNLLPKIKEAFDARKSTEPFLVHIAGQSAAGKSTISSLIVATFDSGIVRIDDYLKGFIPNLNHDSGDPEKPFFAGLNPMVYDLDQLRLDMISLKSGQTIQKPVFDEIHKRRVGVETQPPQDLIVVDGIYALSSPFVDLADATVLVEAPLHDRLMRKVIRNHLSYQQEIDGIIGTYLASDEPTYRFHREGLANAADLVVNNPADPSSDYHQLLKGAEAVNIPTEGIAVPKSSHGSLHPVETLSFTKNTEGEMVFQYAVGGKRLFRGPISQTTYNLVQQFYTIAE